MSFMKFNRKVLQNGLRVLTIPMPSFESATVMVMVGAGSRYETKLNNGISHFLEHMAFKGTKNRPSAMDISVLIDGIGGEMNAFTGKESTGYYIKSASNHIDLSMDVLSDMLHNSLFDEKEIEKEKGVILEEINFHDDNTSHRIGDVYERLLYGDTAMGWNIDGEKKVIKAIKRQDFLDYMSQLYSANQVTVAVAGGIDVEKTLALAEKYFGKMRCFDTGNYRKVVENQTKPEVLIKRKKTEQVNIAIGVRTVSNDHPDKYALSVLSSILGGGMSSRLFTEVREKRGLAYYIRTSSDHYQDCGSLVSMSGVDPKRLDEAITVILEQYHGISNFQFPISNKELEKAKEFLKGHLVLDLEDSRSVAGFYAQQELLEERTDNPDVVLSKIDRIKVEDVQKAAKKYFVEKGLNLAVIGDFSSGQEFEKLLHL